MIFGLFTTAFSFTFFRIFLAVFCLIHGQKYNDFNGQDRKPPQYYVEYTASMGFAALNPTWFRGQLSKVLKLPADAADPNAPVLVGIVRVAIEEVHAPRAAVAALKGRPVAA